ncbi:MAG: flavodoxin-dependent (E)-4-hydroxy-3-methylbut-2-enyl-diphosphate synthase [Bacillota bacterium]|jgi:(E)-4-hydroxy-3-methylbut-2-enyl-diphosphate synthase
MLTSARRQTRTVQIGDLQLGGDAPVLLQSMTNVDTRDISATVAQIERLVEAGCDLVRVSVPDQQAVQSLREIVRQSPCPIVADIHFDYRLAIASIQAGAQKIRINPGNIGSWERVAQVVAAAKEHDAAIRIGVNGGSLPASLLKKYGQPTPQALVEAGVLYLERILEQGFDQLVFSFKSSSVVNTILAYRLAAVQLDWPFHVGVTEAGTTWRGTIHSAVGIGSLLASGIGETIRVSLTADPVEEARVGMELLRALNLRASGISVTSCPTCARTPGDLIGLTEAFEQRIAGLSGDLRVAIMGCGVNGPGEAREADLGLALGPGKALLFVQGEVVDQVPMEHALDRLYAEVVKRCKGNA